MGFEQEISGCYNTAHKLAWWEEDRNDNHEHADCSYTQRGINSSLEIRHHA